MVLLMSAFNFLRNSWLGKAVAIAGAVLIAWGLAVRQGRKGAEARQERANLENYHDVQKTIDEAKVSAAREVGAIPDDALDDELRKQPGAFRE